MKILIVEDDQNKIRQIVDYFKNDLMLDDITERYSYQSGLKEILNNRYDVILLDMSMPTFDISPSETGGRPREFAGKEIIIQMHRRKITIPVVVVTQFEVFGENNQTTIIELDNELSISYNHIYKGIVYYNSALNSWKADLEKILTDLKVG